MRQVRNHIAARRYLLIVPPADMAVFSRRLSPEVEIHDWEDYLGGWTLSRVRAALPETVADRAGWYLQQIVKIAAARAEKGTALIWDADTIPLRPLDFGEDGAVINVYGSREHHAAYFDTLERLTGLRKIPDRSFIAQCLCVRWLWANEFIGAVEAHTGKFWIEAILSEIRGAGISEFSEYESLGTFVCERFPNEIRFNDRRWLRRGPQLVKGLADLTPGKLAALSQVYDFITFERWDTPSIGAAIQTRGEFWGLYLLSKLGFM